jgi:N-acetyl-alpha-D-muramate 1-phosphate uridylyltransferase
MSHITSAMILAAGLGTRMRPLTLTKPKPLMTVCGRTLLDHALDELLPAGINHAVVNVHYLADQVEAHLAARQDLRIDISDERQQLLETGGGVRKALAKLGTIFAVLNADNIWRANGPSALAQLIPHWNSDTMDALLLLTPRTHAIGYSRAGDFERGTDGHLTRRCGDHATYVYASIQIAQAHMFEALPEGPVSTNIAWDSAIARGRLFGCVFDGTWCDIGTPASIILAETL